jgi:hypothetical protein
MERRYLVAALAIVATFAGFSRGFQSLQRISLQHAEHLGVAAKAQREAGAAVRAAAKIRTHLRPRYPEEAQLLAEMNVPIARLEARVADQLARQDAAGQCARAAAQQEALRVHRDAMKLREKMLRANAGGAMAPISFQVQLPGNLDQRIELDTAALAKRLAAQQVKLQIAANQMQAASFRISVSDLPVVDTDDNGDQVSGDGAIHVHCNGKSSRERQAERSARDAPRDAMRQMEYSFNSK